MDQYGGYSGQNPSNAQQGIPIHDATGASQDYTSLSVRRKFLNHKYEEDLKNAKYWRQFTLISSIVGIGIIFFGALGAILLIFIAGPLIAGFVGGLSTLAGLITNGFLHLVVDPAGKANQQLEDTCAMILQEVRRDEDLQLLERLDEEDQKNYIKQLLHSHINPSEPTPDKKARGIAKKIP